jgi:hypothetical protein
MSLEMAEKKTTTDTDTDVPDTIHAIPIREIPIRAISIHLIPHTALPQGIWRAISSLKPYMLDF